jgi:hypothetical protein
MFLAAMAHPKIQLCGKKSAKPLGFFQAMQPVFGHA